VHDGMDAKFERVVIGGCYGCGCCGADVREEDLAGGIFAQGAEIGIV